MPNGARKEKSPTQSVQELSDRIFLYRHCAGSNRLGKLYLFVAIDRTSKFTVAKLYAQMTQAAAGEFLQHVIDAVPYPINKILTDNGSQFVRRASKEFSFKTVFERICHAHEIEHRKTQVCHPWTNGQVERMNRTLKEATVKTYYYATHEQLERHLEDFLDAYNFDKRLKTLQGLTPWQFILEQQKINPQLFKNYVEEPYI